MVNSEVQTRFSRSLVPVCIIQTPCLPVWGVSQHQSIQEIQSKNITAALGRKAMPAPLSASVRGWRIRR